MPERASQRVAHALLFLLIAVALASCTTRRGHVTMAPPVVYDDPTTRKSLTVQQQRHYAAAKGLGSGKLQQSSFSRDVARGRLAVGAEQVLPSDDGGAAPANTSAPASTLVSPFAVTEIARPAWTDYQALHSEQLRDLADREAILESSRLAYDGDPASQGANARLYLVRFDVWVEPDRQNYWSYLWRWLDFSHGFRNYTKDHNVEFTFRIPPIRDAGDPDGPPLVQIRAVSPTFEAISSMDGMQNVISAALAASYGQPGLTGALEYLRESQQEFAELRRYPQIRGRIVSPTECRFTISPRRRLEERGWLGRLFVSRNKIVQKLEPQMHTLHAVLLVRDAHALRKALAPPAASMQKAAEELVASYRRGRRNFAFEWGPFGDHVYLGIDQHKESGRAEDPEDRPPAVPKELVPSSRLDPAVLRLPFGVHATYLELQDPHKPFLLPFDALANHPQRVPIVENPREDRDVDVRATHVDLPLGVFTHRPVTIGLQRIVRPGTADFGIIWKGRNLRRATLTVLEERGSSPPRGADMKLVPYYAPDDDSGEFRLEPLPQQPKPNETLKLWLRAEAAGEVQFVDFPAYTGPWRKETPRKAELSPAAGYARTNVVLTIPIALFGEATPITAIDQVLFGSVAVPVISAKKDDKTNSFQLVVSPPDDPPSPLADVTAIVTVRKGAADTEKTSVAVGHFHYLLWRPWGCASRIEPSAE